MRKSKLAKILFGMTVVCASVHTLKNITLKRIICEGSTAGIDSTSAVIMARVREKD